jgi:hypothetical protein
MIFPFAVGSGVEASDPAYKAKYTTDLLSLIRDGLISSGRYDVVEMNIHNASVQRALQEQKLTEADLAGAIDTTPAGAAKAQKLAAYMGVPYAMIGSIDRFQMLKQKNQAELTATLQLIDVNTSKVRNTFSSTGRVPIEAGKDNAEMSAGIAATYDAAEKLLTSVRTLDPAELMETQQSAEEAVPYSGSKKHKSLLPAMIGALIIGFLASGG